MAVLGEKDLKKYSIIPRVQNVCEESYGQSLGIFYPINFSNFTQLGSEVPWRSLDPLALLKTFF